MKIEYSQTCKVLKKIYLKTLFLQIHKTAALTWDRGKGNSRTTVTLQTSGQQHA